MDSRVSQGYGLHIDKPLVSIARCGQCGKALIAERKVFIRSFVSEVKITGDEAVLTYTMPMPSQGTKEEKVPVLAIVHHGGPWRTVPELLFEKKQLIPAVQQLLVSCLVTQHKSS